ncbi:phage tail family protein [Cellulomonas rhizosphaerae]|uniref:Phage tail protein n=1 Tax=Cellulomonas rhizosphaerae TaxID=2293719 RepID=A0A413RJH8_9CELL|nr:hypothetical protein [Cellulomonas rhizosphaerae]RHA38745.1 hypothetical protein D1825_13510 [Cellulomonas rhizosphaerae]
MSILLVSPGPVPDPPAPSPFADMDFTWTGWDGSSFQLTGRGRTQAIHLQAGVRGLTFPPAEEHTTSSPARRGQRFRSHRELARDVTWPLWVWEDSGSTEWLKFDAAFRRTLRRDRPGMWTVTHPFTGEHRSLMLRLGDDGDPSWDTTPGKRAWKDYQLRMIADDPMWAGAPITSPLWGATPGVNFTGPSDSAPDFYISAPTTTGEVDMANPGDVPVWPTWTVTGRGAATSAVLTVNGMEIGTPTLTNGQVLTINTDKATARLDGARAGNLLSPREFEPIPDGESVTVGVNITGDGTVQCSIIPLYNAAW